MTKTNLQLNTFLASLAAYFALIFAAPLAAEEIDFSCMKDRVRAKIQVSQRYQEYDVIVENRCRGTVYWSMCIERMDPWTNEILETLTPSGKVQAEKKLRVNLQMMERMNEAQSEGSFEEFYTSFAYGINSVAKAPCVASECERKKRAIRAELRANDKAWNKAKAALADQLATDCPKTGWNSSEEEDCEARINRAHLPEQEQFAQQDTEIRAKLSAVDPERCQIHSRG